MLLPRNMILMDETLTRLKKFMTLMPNNWLNETHRRMRRGGLAESRRKGIEFLELECFFRKKL